MDAVNGYIVKLYEFGKAVPSATYEDPLELGTTLDDDLVWDA